MDSRVRSGSEHLSYGMSYLLQTVKIDRCRLGSFAWPLNKTLWSLLGGARTNSAMGHGYFPWRGSRSRRDRLTDDLSAHSYLVQQTREPDQNWAELSFSLQTIIKSGNPTSAWKLV